MFGRKRKRGSVRGSAQHRESGRRRGGCRGDGVVGM